MMESGQCWVGRFPTSRVDHVVRPRYTGTSGATQFRRGGSQLHPRTKAILLAVLAVVVVILIAQNTREVPIRVLLFKLPELPLAVVLIVALAVGFVGGLLAASRLWDQQPKEGGKDSNK